MVEPGILHLKGDRHGVACRSVGPDTLRLALERSDWAAHCTPPAADPQRAALEACPEASHTLAKEPARAAWTAACPSEEAGTVADQRGREVGLGRTVLVLTVAVAWAVEGCWLKVLRPPARRPAN